MCFWETNLKELKYQLDKRNKSVNELIKNQIAIGENVCQIYGTLDSSDKSVLDDPYLSEIYDRAKSFTDFAIVLENETIKDYNQSSEDLINIISRMFDLFKKWKDEHTLRNTALKKYENNLHLQKTILSKKTSVTLQEQTRFYSLKSQEQILKNLYLTRNNRFIEMINKFSTLAPKWFQLIFLINYYATFNFYYNCYNCSCDTSNSFFRGKSYKSLNAVLLEDITEKFHQDQDPIARKIEQLTIVNFEKVAMTKDLVKQMAGCNIRETVYCTACYDFEPQQPDDLRLRVGDKIFIISKEETGWWRGANLDGDTGNFPSNYVTQFENDRIGQ